MSELCEDDSPRTHHYLFVHRAMPRILFSRRTDPSRIAAANALDRALLETWTEVGDALPESERLAPDGLHSELVTLGDIQAVLITLPTAQHVTEAHFIALAPTNPPRKRRYIVLEFSLDSETNQPVTVLGEWRRNRHHANYGRGPVPSGELFLQRVQQLLER